MKIGVVAVIVATCLSVHTSAAIPNVIAANACSSGTITIACPAAHVTGALNSSDCALQNGGWFDQYAIALPELEFTATVTGTNSTPFMLVLSDPIDGEIFQSSSGFGTATISYTPPDPNLVYTLTVATTSGAGGAYTLDVTCGADQTTSCQWSGTLACGSTVSGETSPNECVSASGDYFWDYYKLPLTKGDIVEVTLTSASWFPMFLEVAEPDYTGGIYSQSGTGNETLVFTATKTATHRINVTSQDARERGQYTISVKCLSSNCGKVRSVRH